MSVYESQFGTDWDEIGRDEAVRRAYALGVAASTGEGDIAEFHRIRDRFAAPYDRSLVELAYQEGKNKAEKLLAESDDDADVWSKLVLDEDLDAVEPATVGRSRQSIPTSIERAASLDRPDRRSIRIVSRPSFLTRT